MKLGRFAFGGRGLRWVGVFFVRFAWGLTRLSLADALILEP